MRLDTFLLAVLVKKRGYCIFFMKVKGSPFSGSTELLRGERERGVSCSISLSCRRGVKFFFSSFTAKWILALVLICAPVVRAARLPLFIVYFTAGGILYSRAVLCGIIGIT